MAGNVVQVFADYIQSVNQYNADGFLVASTDALGRTTRYTRDSKQRLTKITGPLGYREAWVYGSDASSGTTVTDVLLNYVDARGLRTAYTYDANRRIATVKEEAANNTTSAELTSVTSNIRTTPAEIPAKSC